MANASKLFVNPHHKMGKINAEIQGHFAEHLGRCIYEGLYVGEDSDIPNTKGMRNDVVNALKEMKIPVLRWPGGCFADEYHWQDGIGPKEQRKKMVNTHWGGVIEDNSFGTHEFMELCRQLGCKAYINGNVGSGSVKEMSEWVEYLTFDGMSPMADLRAANGHPEPWVVDYFGVGNENWGCGGNMTPEYYGKLYRHYQTYIRNYNPEQKIYKVCCGASDDDYNWTRGVLSTTYYKAERQNGFMDGLSLHFYTMPGGWEDKKCATEFDESDWYKTLKRTMFMESLIAGHGAIMDEYDPDKKVGMIIDEWGTWWKVEDGTNPGFLYQQNTMRDALVAAINLNIFNKNCDRVKMANIAQTLNVLQAVILTDGAKMLLTPTYHVFNMQKHHQDAELLYSYVESKPVGLQDDYMIPNLQESASLGLDGKVHITLNNLSISDDYEIETQIADSQVKSVKATILTAPMTAHNTFDSPETVKPTEFTAFTITDNKVSFKIPGGSVMHLAVTI
ncbi:MAG: alpha-N-arabinofuranosidase [Lachnospiraceae bacterium]|nr:alpha-N-arabinofuranosidase [Lachnospiraceae bacterium]